MIGRFVSWDSYLHIILSGLKGEFFQSEDYVKHTYKALSMLLKGCIEATDKEMGIG